MLTGFDRQSQGKPCWAEKFIAAVISILWATTHEWVWWWSLHKSEQGEFFSIFCFTCSSIDWFLRTLKMALSLITWKATADITDIRTRNLYTQFSDDWNITYFLHTKYFSFIIQMLVYSLKWEEHILFIGRKLKVHVIQQNASDSWRNQRHTRFNLNHFANKIEAFYMISREIRWCHSMLSLLIFTVTNQETTITMEECMWCK